MTPVEFLRRVHTRGPWALAAIDPDLPSGHPDKIKCATLKREPDDVESFIERYNDRRNIYFQLNRVRRDLGTRRARKQDIVSCVGLHCDVDPPSDVKDLAKWQRTKRAALLDWRRFDLPAPSVVVFSGTGFQLIWLLDEPTDAIDAVESRNRYLAQALGGDPGTWNVDRLLRLPGTWNYPGEQKRRKYRRTEATLAEVMRP